MFICKPYSHPYRGESNSPTVSQVRQWISHSILLSYAERIAIKNESRTYIWTIKEQIA